MKPQSKLYRKILAVGVNAEKEQFKVRSFDQFEIADPRRSVTRCAPLPVWQLAIGWFLMVPMLYISSSQVLTQRSSNISFAATGEDPATSPSHKFAVGLICLIFAILIVPRYSQVLALGRRMKSMLAFPALALLSFAWSYDPRQSIVSGLVLFAFTLFAIYVAGRFPFQRQLELIMLAGAIALPASIVIALFLPAIGRDGENWRGIFGHKQSCAIVSLFWLITALNWTCSGIYRRMFRALCICMCVVLVAMSKSRTGWFLTLGALVLCGAIWLLQKMPAKQALALILFIPSVIGVAAYGMYSNSMTILDSVGKDATLSQRTIIWSATWMAVLRHPVLGYGFAAFWKGLYGPSQGVVLASGWGLTQAQDGFLDVWLGIGVVGIVLLAIMTGQALRNAARCFFAESTRSYVRWCIVVIVCTLLYNIGESAIGRLQMEWFLFLLACIGLEQAALSARSRRIEPSTGYKS